MIESRNFSGQDTPTNWRPFQRYDNYLPSAKLFTYSSLVTPMTSSLTPMTSSLTLMTSSLFLMMSSPTLMTSSLQHLVLVQHSSSISVKCSPYNWLMPLKAFQV